jgi:hypothetical protein
VRIAQKIGGVSILLPEGIEHLGDCPFTLHRAISDALRVLSYEEFPVSERPPKRIWMDGERLGEWWEKIERERKAQFSLDRDDADGDSKENALELIARG